jgi:hypothetical protein
MLDALVRIAGATTIVNTAKGFSVNDVTQAPIQEQVTLGGEICTQSIEADTASQQVLDRNRQVPDSPAGGMIHSIGNRGRDRY